jgi:hypothetical protein
MTGKSAPTPPRRFHNSQGSLPARRPTMDRRATLCAAVQRPAALRDLMNTSQRNSMKMSLYYDS